jgi:hypothetical protein
MRVFIAAATLCLGSASQAAAPQQYALRTAADLARVCGTPSTDADAATAHAFCHGFLAGSYAYFQAVTPAAQRFVCTPDPAPTRAKVAADFVAWMNVHPQLANDSAVDTLFRFAAEAFPCQR